MAVRPKLHIHNKTPEFSAPRHHRPRPQILGLAKIRARYWAVDSCPELQVLRSRTSRRANTRDEREASLRALCEAIMHRVDLVSGRVWASQDLLAKDCELTNSRVCRAIDDLANAGFLQVFTLLERGDGKRRRTIMYVRDALYVALGFRQAEVEANRMSIAKHRAEKQIQATGRVQESILRRVLEKEAKSQKHESRRVAKRVETQNQKAQTQFEFARERMLLMIELKLQFPEYSARQLAIAADELIERRRRQSA